MGKRFSCLGSWQPSTWQLCWNESIRIPHVFPISQLRYMKEKQGSPARMSASSMNWVLKRMTLSDLLSLRRFHTRCLERGSDPAVGSSSSKICTTGKHIKSFSPSRQNSFKKQYTSRRIWRNSLELSFLL